MILLEGSLQAEELRGGEGRPDAFGFPGEGPWRSRLSWDTSLPERQTTKGRQPGLMKVTLLIKTPDVRRERCRLAVSVLDLLLWLLNQKPCEKRVKRPTWSVTE